MTLWYTITVLGQPVDGSTDDREEAIEWLKRANDENAYDGLAKITVSKAPLAW